MAEGEEDISRLPLEAKLAHKSWKARIAGYTELITLFSKTVAEDDPAFRPYFANPALVGDWVKDANAVSQEKGVEAACAFVEFGGKAASRSRSEIMPFIVEKCLGSSRAGTKAKAIELCLLFVETEEDSGEGLITGLVPGLDFKQPKVVTGVVTALKEITKQFGPKTVSVKPVLATLPKIFGHSDKNVRAEGTQLAITLHCYLGPALEPQLNDLKPVQVKELKEIFQQLDLNGEGFGSPASKPTRFTRTQQRERERKGAETALAGNGSGEDVEVEEEEAEVPTALDPYEYVTPVNVLGKLPPDFYTLLSSSKWKDRQSVLEPLLSQVSAPRLEPGSYDELVRALAGRMSDANILCLTLAANCLEKIAIGLRKDFAGFKNVVLVEVLKRTKEKKTSVLEALGAALDACFATITLPDITEEVLNSLKDKNPSVKEQTLKFITRCFQTTTMAPTRPDIALYVESLSRSLAESQEPIRVAAAEAMGTLMKIVGERAMGGLDGIDELRKVKVMEAFEKAEIKYRAAAPPKPKPAPVPPVPKVAAKPAICIPKPSPAKASEPPSVSEAAPPSPLPPKTGPPARLLAKKQPAASAPKKPPPAASKAPPPPAAYKETEPLKYSYTQESAEIEAETVLPANLVAEMGDSAWKTRLAAIEALYDWINGGDGQNVNSELVVRFLSKKPGWKESNFQVSSKLFAIFQLLGEKSFLKSAAAISIPPMSEKLGDMKLKKPAGDALTTYAEKSTLQFVLNHAYEPMSKLKAPKALADSILWVDQALQDFGIGGLAIRELIEFLKVGLKSSNAAVRTNATKTLVTLKLFVGADISTFLGDLNPALLSTIESEFAKIDGQTPPEPTRFCAEAVVQTQSSNKSGGGNPMDELFPRVDIEKVIPGALVPSCNDPNWKIRKETLENIQSILESNKRLKPSLLSDLTTALKLRLADSNKIIQTLALDIVSRLATGMGKPFDRIARIYAPPVAMVLADAKPNIRAAGVATLSAISEAAGLDSFINSLDKPLETPNPLLRKELLGWLESELAKTASLQNLDLTPLVSPVISCLEDKSADVRKPAVAILPALVSKCGYSFVVDQTSKLKPASKSTVMPLIEAAKGSSNTLAPATITARPRQSSSKVMAPTSNHTNGDASSTSSFAQPALSRSIGPSRAATKQLRPPSSLGSEEKQTAPSSLRPRQSLGGRTIQRVASPAPLPPSPLDKPAPFRSSDTDFKRNRCNRETGALKWLVEGAPRPDQIDTLAQLMTPHTSPELLNVLFSKDHNAERDFSTGLTIVDEAASNPTIAETYGIETAELHARLIANVDLIFRYITLRIGLTSTTITVKSLDVIDHMIIIIDQAGHKLIDYEVGALLYSLINKVGDGKETIRLRVRSIFKSLCSVYPFSKLFAAVLEHGITSKNARTRAESAEELGMLFQRYGVSPFSVSKSLPQVAKLISDRDASVRSAALTTIAAVYTLVGPEVYNYVGALADKERSMLDERLKRTLTSVITAPLRPTTPIDRAASPNIDVPRSPLRGVPMAKSKIGMLPRKSLGARPASALGIQRPSSSASVRDSISSNSNAPSHDGGLRRPIGSLQPPSARPSITRPQSSPSNTTPTSRLSAGRGTVEQPSPTAQDTAVLVGQVVSDDLVKSSETLKRIQKDIVAHPTFLIPVSNELMEAVAHMMSVAFTGLDENSSPNTLRLCKHLMQILTSFFDNKELGHAVSTDTLTILLAELTGRLLDTADNAGTEAISSLSKILNVVLIRIFHHADPTSCFSALFTVLHDATIDLRDLRGEELTDRAKYAELVMKCLWKVSKTVKDSLEAEELSPSRLLRDINNFLDCIPPAEWRRRATDAIPLADMPLRTVKTILQQIVGVYGEEVFEHLDEIEAAESSFVYQYLFRLSNTNASEGTLSRHTSVASLNPRPASSGPIVSSTLVSAFAPQSDAPAASASPALSPSPEIELNNRLKEIFDLIGDPGKSRQGIEELYNFQKLHPEAEGKILTWMSGTGNYFQTYLRRALENLAQTDLEKSTSSSPSWRDSGRPMSYSTVPSRPGSTLSNGGTPTRPQSVFGIPSPRTSSRMSVTGSGSGSSNVDKLNELKSMFGYELGATEE